MTMPEAHDATTVIAAYRRLRAQVAEMLALTEAGDWATLIERQHAYLTQVERLKALDAGCRLDGDEATRKAELLEAILADDLVIRERLMARRDELGQLMDRSRRQRDLQRTYGRQGTALHRGADAADKGTT